MSALPLILKNGHLFVELDGNLWLFDTGAPTSFGDDGTVTIAGEEIELGHDYMGLSANTLSGYVEIQCRGLLGADVLGRFDHLLDCAEGRLLISKEQLTHEGQALPVEEFMGVPIVGVEIAGRAYRMFFDTGAQVSYWQDDALTGYPEAGVVSDFYPGVGAFETDSHQVPVRVGEMDFTLRCGRLPALLGATLMMAGTHGILAGRVVGYFPRRSILSI